MFNASKLSAKEFIIATIITAVFYAILLCVFMYLFAPKKIVNCPRCRQAISEYQAAQRAKQEKERKDNKKYQESLYSHSGGINPGFKEMVANAPVYQEAPKERAYEQQLEEYRLKLAEERQRRLEQERQAQKEAEEEIALIKQEREERLKEQALQKQQELQTNQNIALNGTVGPSKTFKAPASKNVSRKPQQQKTQIGTLKTSRLGESSFQK